MNPARRRRAAGASSPSPPPSRRSSQALSAGADPSTRVGAERADPRLHAHRRSTTTASAWLTLLYEFGGLGARAGADGPDATGAFFLGGRSVIPQIEPLEAQYPFVVRSTRLVARLRRAGRWRGGLGVETVIELLADAEIDRAGRPHGRPAARRAAAASPGAAGSWCDRARATARVERLAGPPGRRARSPPGDVLRAAHVRRRWPRARRGARSRRSCVADVRDRHGSRSEARPRVGVATRRASTRRDRRAPPRLRSLGVDVGGTFTDVVLADGAGGAAHRQGAHHPRRPAPSAWSTACAGAGRRRRSTRRRRPRRARHHARHQRDPAALGRPGRAGHDRGVRRHAAPRARGPRRGGPLRPVLHARAAAGRSARSPSRCASASTPHGDVRSSRSTDDAVDERRRRGGGAAARRRRRLLPALLRRPGPRAASSPTRCARRCPARSSLRRPRSGRRCASTSGP